MYLIDKHTKLVEKIKKKTNNSFLVTRTKFTKKGINCDNWFTVKDLHTDFFTLKTCAEHVILNLEKCKKSDFADLYVKYRMESYKIFHNGLILSASHGIDYFNNIIKYYENPDEWLNWGDKDRRKSIYENNFVLLLKNNKI